MNKSKVSDFQWDPFDEETLAVGCDDGIVKIWRLGPNGLDRSLEEPSVELRGHVERLYCIKYHPYIKNVIASASYDRTVKVWNIVGALVAIKWPLYAKMVLFAFMNRWQVKHRY